MQRAFRAGYYAIQYGTYSSDCTVQAADMGPAGLQLITPILLPYGRCEPVMGSL